MPLDLDKLPPIPADAPKYGSWWRHWKGDEVQVTDICRHSETGEILIAYRHLDENWCRPLTMWQDEARPGIIRFTPVVEA